MSCLNTIRHDLCIVQGDDVIFRMAYKDSAGSAIDLTGSSMDLEFNNSTYDRTATITDAAGGLFEFVYAAAETSTFGLSNVDGVVQLTDSLGMVSSLYRITLKVEGR